MVLAPQSAYKSPWRGYTTNILNHIVLSLLSCLYHQAKQCTILRGYVPGHYHVFALLYPPELETRQPWSRRKITTTLNCSDRMNRQTLKVQITLNLQHQKQPLDIFVGLCSLNTFTDMLGLSLTPVEKIVKEDMFTKQLCGCSTISTTLSASSDDLGHPWPPGSCEWCYTPSLTTHTDTRHLRTLGRCS